MAWSLKLPALSGDQLSWRNLPFTSSELNALASRPYFVSQAMCARQKRTTSRWHTQPAMHSAECTRALSDNFRRSKPGSARSAPATLASHETQRGISAISAGRAASRTSFLPEPRISRSIQMQLRFAAILHQERRNSLRRMVHDVCRELEQATLTLQRWHS